MSKSIAVFDYKVKPNNPIGSLHLRMLKALCREYDFTVFAVEFENPCPERIKFVRIPAPKRPQALLFLVYHLMAPLWYLLYRLRHWTRFDLVQMVESNLVFGDVSYAHFCHRAYLKRHWQPGESSGIRGRFRWLDHKVRALIEPLVYRHVKQVVVPSRGLARELAEEYRYPPERIPILSNPVDSGRMLPPQDFDRAGFRKSLGILDHELALVFTALGHFERKGLYLLLEALTHLPKAPLKVVVVGGEADLLRRTQQRLREMNLEQRVVLAGMQKDVRPYLWAADAYVLPSQYEVFPLGAEEAAAAGLPLIVTPLNGIEEFLEDGKNGILVQRSPAGVAQGIARFLALSPQERQAMGDQARHDVQRFCPERFVEGWRTFFEHQTCGRG